MITLPLDTPIDFAFSLLRIYALQTCGMMVVKKNLRLPSSKRILSLFVYGPNNFSSPKKSSFNRNNKQLIKLQIKYKQSGTGIIE